MTFAISEIFLLLAMLSGLVLPNPLGVPPLPEDPRLLGCAPAGTLAYVQWFGTAEPNPRSPNATEQLAAEPDVRRFVTAAVDAITSGVEVSSGGLEVARDGVELMRTALVRPGCAFVVADPQSPQVVGYGFVVNVGDRAARVLELSQRIADQSGSATDRVRTIEGVEFRVIEAGGVDAGWTVHGEHLAFAFGPTSMNAIAAGLGSARGLADNPRFSATHARVAVARPSVRTFVDVETIVGLLRAMEPEAAAALDAIGLSGIAAYNAESGLEASGFVGRAMLSTSERAGLLALLDGPGIAQSSLDCVPADATLASVARLDPSRAWAAILDVMRAIDPRDTAQIEREIDGAMQQLFELDLEDDLLAHVGDEWAVWSSPSQGSLVGLGACASVSLTDERAFARSFDRLMTRAATFAPKPEPDQYGRFARGAYLERLEIDGATIHWLNVVGEEFPLAPAVCVHGGRLWLATFPQVLRAAIARPVGGATLADAPDAERALGARIHSRVDAGAILETLYSPLLMAAQLASAEIQREGGRIDVTAVPRLTALRPHIGVETVSITVGADGVFATSHGTIPHVDPALGTLFPLAGVAPWWFFTRIEMARAIEVEARRAAEAEAEARRREAERKR